MSKSDQFLNQKNFLFLCPKFCSSETSTRQHQHPTLPAGRLCTTPGKNGKKAPSPRLWLETVNADFDAPVTKEGWEPAVLSHAIAKAEEMKVTLSVARPLLPSAKRVAGGADRGGFAVGSAVGRRCQG